MPNNQQSPLFYILLSSGVSIIGTIALMISFSEGNQAFAKLSKDRYLETRIAEERHECRGAMMVMMARSEEILAGQEAGR